MSEKIEPVAWVERTEGGLTRMWSGDLSAWAGRPANPEPLYSATTVSALEARIHELRDALTRISWHSRDITGAPDMIAIASNALELDHRSQDAEK